MKPEDKEFLIAILQGDLDSYDAMHGVRDYGEEIKHEEEHLATLRERFQKTNEYKEQLRRVIEALKVEQ